MAIFNMYLHFSFSFLLLCMRGLSHLEPKKNYQKKLRKAYSLDWVYISMVEFCRKMLIIPKNSTRRMAMGYLLPFVGYLT